MVLKIKKRKEKKKGEKQNAGFSVFAESKRVLKVSAQGAH